MVGITQSLCHLLPVSTADCCLSGSGVVTWPSVSSFALSHLHHAGQDGSTLSATWKAYCPVLVLPFPKAFSFSFSFSFSFLSFFLCLFLCFFSFFLSFFNVYLFLRERERDRAQAGEGQRERETQILKWALGSELSAQSPTRGSNSETTDHDLSRSRTLS